MTTIAGSYSDFTAKRAVRALHQARVNGLLEDKGANAAEAEIRRLATEEHLPYPQYAGRFSGPEWVMGRANCKLEGKGGVMAMPGDYLLVRQDFAGGVEFYSVRLGWLCLANACVTPLCGWDEAFKLWRRLADERREAER